MISPRFSIRATRAAGLALGAAIPGAVALIAAALRIDFVATVAGIGTVVGGLLGGLFAPGALRTRQPFGEALRLSVLSVPLGAVIFAAAPIADRSSQAIGATITTVALAAVFSVLAIPVLLPVVFPIALAAILTGRRLARTSAATVRMVLATLLAVDLIAAVAAPVIADRLSSEVVSPSGDILRSEPHWLETLFASRRLEITVINRGPRPVWLDVTWPSGSGMEAGTGSGAPGCMATAQLYLVEDGWRLRAGADDGVVEDWSDPRSRPSPLASSADHPGDAQLVLDVDRAGTIRIRTGWLSDDELGDVPGCASTG